MSHWTRVQTQLVDLEIIKAALAQLDSGIEVLEKGSVRGHSHTNCDYVIRLRGHYDVGLKRMAGIGVQPFQLVWDEYGQHVERELGQGCEKLLQTYAEIKLTRDARKQGMRVSKTKGKDGTIHLTVTTS